MDMDLPIMWLGRYIWEGNISVIGAEVVWSPDCPSIEAWVLRRECCVLIG
jgi:hypothetical protein